jgi:hypothetical protein
MLARVSNSSTSFVISFRRKSVVDGGVGAQAVIHFGMHGTVEWLPGLYKTPFETFL